MFEKLALTRPPAAAMVAAIVLCAVWAAPDTARGESAQSKPPIPGANPDYDAAFKAMAADPGNVEKTLAFADQAARAGDLEGAIAALERLLIFNPNLPSVRAQLGILYYRLGSYALARNYLERAAQTPDLPPTLADQVHSALAAIDVAESDNRFSGSVSVGFRGQTNANAGPNGGISRILGFDALLTQNFQGRSDENFFGAGELHHVYDPHWEDGITWDSDLTAYGAKQFHVITLSLAQIGLETGPRIPVDGWAGDISVRPYFVADANFLGGSVYYSGYGGGVAVTVPAADNIAVLGSFETQNLSYHATANTRPLANDQSGPVIVMTVQPTYAIDADRSVSLLAQASRADVRASYQSYWRYSLLPSFSQQFDPGLTDHKWQVSGFFGRSWTVYDAPQLVIDPGTTRDDREWDLGATLTAGLTDALAAQIQLEQSWVTSSLPNYRYDNFTGLVGLSYGF